MEAVELSRMKSGRSDSWKCPNEREISYLAKNQGPRRGKERDFDSEDPLARALEVYPDSVGNHSREVLSEFR